ncbi:MAG: hypothetical protein A2046_13760 [Bacteroidetes bacterium GWA2_30_7]|nr:MAG: hypothetical protein A2046_13760 [Bacteroidetes bacterium GWA2_30_7]
MSTLDLKRNFHLLIDSIDNENILLNFYNLMKTRTSSKDGKFWETLTSQEQNELLLAFDENFEPENLISLEVMKKKHKKWL